MEEMHEHAGRRAQRRRRISTDRIVAVAAITISVMTLFVYIFQSRIMLEQQHNSVWPHVEWTMTNINEEEQQFYISIINKGVGPALIKEVKFYLDGKVYLSGDYTEFMKNLLGEGRRDSLWIVYSTVDGRVLAPGEEIKIFNVKSWKGVRIPPIDYNRFRYTLCYCSIYNDCWTTDGTISGESKCK